MRIVIVGSGNVATHMSLALKEVGYDIVQVYSKTMANAVALSERLSCAATDRVEGILPDADVYIFSIKDKALEDVAAQMKVNGGACFIHTAGSMPMDVFRSMVSRYGVLYPMQTFSKGRDVDFRDVPCFIEASDDDTLSMIRTMAESITTRCEECSSEKRKKMHLAAVFACNFTNHCYHLAERIVEKEGLDFSLFHPLIRETASKVMTMSPRDAQTGPMVRWDTNVMDMQIALIDDERTRDIYRLMAESIAHPTPHKGREL